MENAMRFLNRWLIEGTLTTHTPLRIGDGGTIDSDKREMCEYLRKRNDGNSPDEPIKISTIAVDCNSRAYIPATAIKGSLRSWARASGMNQELRDIFFGSDPPKGSKRRNTDENEQITAGKVQFWNAFSDPNNYLVFELPGWHPQRLSAI